MTCAAKFPTNENERLARLRALSVLDTKSEMVLDTLTRLASDVCEVPIALISLIDADRQWFKANIGLPKITETARDVAFCSHAILSQETMEVNDARLDPRFAENPLVTGNPNIRFYAGAPLSFPKGLNIGTLCVIDRIPRKLCANQRAILAKLSSMVVQALESRV